MQLPRLPDADMGFKLDMHLLKAGAEQSGQDFGDSFWTEGKLTMSEESGQFALSIREVGESENMLKHFFHMILQGKFSKKADNFYDFQVLQHSAKWRGHDDTIYSDASKSFAQFSGVVAQDAQNGFPVSIKLTFKSRGLWDRLETKNKVTELIAVGHVEFGGWFLSQDAEATHVAGKPTMQSPGRVTTIAGRGARYLDGVNHRTHASLNQMV